MCGGVWELVGCIEVRDLGYDLPACIDRLGGFQQHSTASRSVDGSGTLGIPSGLPIRIGAAYIFRRVFLFVEEGVP